MSEKAALLQEKKKNGEKIVVLTCYDYPTALLEEAAGVDVVFVGDSVGTNVLGYSHEREVTLDDMIHHLKAVRRGVSDAYLLVDMPHQSYSTDSVALDNALRLLSLGADGVKLEGLHEGPVRTLSARQIDVWCHLGLNPQLHVKKKLKATTAAAAVDLIDDALALEEAGAAFMVLEMIPEEVACVATERLAIPTIGIGAGRSTDGQVLVVTDLLGINDADFRHVTRNEEFRIRGGDAVRKYAEDVRSGSFPSRENAWHLKKNEREDFTRRINRSRSEPRAGGD